MALKDWKREHNKYFIKNRMTFWRNVKNHGFISINKVERGSLAWSEGKYQIEINTPYHIHTHYKNEIKDAVKFAKSYMRKH